MTLEARLGSNLDALGGSSTAVLVAPAGKELVAAGPCAAVWSVETGARLCCLEPRGPAAAMTFSGDGARLFVLRAGEVQVYDAGSWRRSHAWALPDASTHHVWHLVADREGARLFGSNSDETLAWEVATGALLWRKPGTGPLALTPDGARLARAPYLELEAGRILEPSTGKVLAELEKAGGCVLGFSADGERLVGGTKRGALQVWATATGALVGAVEAHGGKAVRGVLAAGGALCTWGMDFRLRRWELAVEGPPLRALDDAGVPLGGHLGSLSRGGRYFADASWNVLEVRDLAAGGAPLRPEPTRRRKLTALEVSDDGAYLLTLSDERTSVVRRLPGGEVELERPRLALHCVAGSPGSFFAFQAPRRRLLHFHLGSAEETAGLHFEQAGYRSFAMAADGSFWLEGQKDSLRCYERDGALRWEDRTPHLGRPLLSRDGSTVWVDQCDDRGFALYALVRSAAKYERLGRVKLRRGEDWPLALSEDGRRAVLRVPGGLRVLSLPEGKPVARVPERESFGPARFSPDGETLAYGTASGSVVLVSAARGKEKLRWDAHHAPVTGLAFSRDGARLYSCSEDSTAAVWLLPK